jgi:hypothetical protein
MLRGGGKEGLGGGGGGPALAAAHTRGKEAGAPLPCLQRSRCATVAPAPPAPLAAPAHLPPRVQDLGLAGGDVVAQEGVVAAAGVMRMTEREWQLGFGTGTRLVSGGLGTVGAAGRRGGCLLALPRA